MNRENNFIRSYREGYYFHEFGIRKQYRFSRFSYEERIYKPFFENSTTPTKIWCKCFVRALVRSKRSEKKLKNRVKYKHSANCYASQRNFQSFIQNFRFATRFFSLQFYRMCTSKKLCTVCSSFRLTLS